MNDETELKQEIARIAISKIEPHDPYWRWTGQVGDEIA